MSIRGCRLQALAAVIYRGVPSTCLAMLAALALLPAAEPDHRWPLDGDGSEVVGGAPAVVQGTPEWISGAPVGGAVLADGDDSLVVEGFTGIAPDDRSFAVAAWMRVGPGAAGVVVRSSAAGQTSKGPAQATWSLGIAGDGRPAFTLHRRLEREKKNKPPEVIENGASATAAIDLRDGAWHHVAGVFRGGNLELYLDGELVASDGIRGQFPNTRLEVSRLEVLAAGSVGALDQVVMTATPFTAGDIAALVAEGEIVDNQAPLAAAGADLSEYAGVVLTLDGSGSSDPDAGPQPLAYQWTQVDGPVVAIADATAAQASILPSEAGTYRFELTVTDGAASSSDSVTVTVHAPPAPAFEQAVSSAGEAAGAITLAIRIAEPALYDLMVPVALGAGDTDASDLTLDAASVTIPAGASLAQVPLTVLDDGRWEPAEQVAVTLAAAQVGGVGSPAEHLLTIQDDDVVTLVVAGDVVHLEADGDAAFPLVLDQPAPAQLALDYELDGAVGTLLIPSGATTAAIPVPNVDDAVPEPDRVVPLTLTGITGAPRVALGAAISAALTIQDDDSLAVALGAAAYAGAEGDTLQVDVVLGHPAPAELRVAYTLSAGTDAAAPGGPLVVPAGAIGGTIAVSLLDDDQPELEETVTLTLDGIAGFARAQLVAPASADIAIADDDPVGVAFASATSAAGESAGMLSVAIVLDAPAPVDLTLAYTVAGTAGDADRTLAPSPLTIPAGATTAAIALDLVDDALFEGDETVVLTLTGIDGFAGASLGEPAVHTLTIGDDDEAPAVTIAFQTATALEAEGDGAIAVPLAISGPLPVPVELAFTVAGSAGETDRSVVASPLSLPAGASSGSIALTLLDDAVWEGDETVVLTLSDVGGATGVELGAGTSHTLTIADDDRITAAFAAASTIQTETETVVQIQVDLDQPAPAAVSIAYTVGGDAAEAAEVAPGPLVIPAGATGGAVAVPVHADAVPETDRQVTLQLTAISGAERLDLGAPAGHVVTIADDDTLTARMAVAERSGEEGSVLQIAVALDHPAPTALALGYRLEPALQASVAAGPLTIPAGASGGSIALSLDDDTAVELPDLETLRLTGLTGFARTAIGAPDTTAVTIEDDDPLVLAFVQAASSAAESAGTIDVPIAFNAPTPAELQLAFTVAGSADADDRSLPASPLVVPAGAVSATIPVQLVDDDLVEDDETVVLTLTAVSGLPLAQLGGTFEHVLTITSEDVPPPVTVDLAAAAQVVAEGAGQTAIDLVFSEPLPAEVAIGYALAGSSDASDRSLAAGPLVVPAGASSASIPVTILDDDEWEVDETVELTLTGVTGHSRVVLGTATTHVLTITDDDILSVAFATAASSAVEAESVQVVDIVLSNPALADLSLAYGVGGSAAEAAEVAPSPLVIPAGNTSATIAVPVHDDQVPELDRSVVLTLAGITGAERIVLGATTVHSVTIVDDDDLGYAFAAAALSGEEGGFVQVQVVLGHPAPAEIALDYALAPTDDATLQPGPLVIPAGASAGGFALALVDDDLVEGEETVELSLTAAAGFPRLAPTAPQTLTVTILDNDAAGPPLARDDRYVHADSASDLVVPATAGVLANDDSASPASLQAERLSDPTVGTLVAFAADGSFTYRPPPDHRGVVEFTYRPSDAFGTGDAATVRIEVAMALDAQRSPLVASTGYDHQAFTDDPTWRAAYLAEVSPGRIWETAPPGGSETVIAAGSARYLRVAPQGIATLVATTEPAAPVTFHLPDAGSFSATGRKTITVQADANGEASVDVQCPTIGRLTALAASPRSVGQVRYIIRVEGE